MKKISNPLVLNILMRLLILLVVAKAISLFLYFYLPSDGVELKEQQNYQPKYQRVNFINMLSTSSATTSSYAKNSTRNVLSSSANISSMVLKGLYGNKDSGFIIIAMKSNPKKTSIVSVGESYQGYTLIKILAQSVIFEKNSKEYILEVDKLNTKAKASITKVERKSYGGSEVQKEVTRNEIRAYAKDPKKIWKDISIIEVKQGKKIKGFKVTRINPKSDFATLGLRRGDMIVRANNIELKSYKDAIAIYEKIDTIDAVQLVVLRNNQEVELVYEIN